MNRNKLREHSVEEVTVTTKFLELCSRSILIIKIPKGAYNDKYSTE